MLIHILLKDAREHRIAIALAVSMIAIWILGSGALAVEHSPAPELLSFIAWTTLIGRLVHSEAIPGERQYWLTRPVPRAALLGAKVLGCVVFLHVPYFFVDALALMKHGFNPTEHVGGLLWKQALAFVTGTIPMLAVAAITRTFAQYALVLLGIAAAGILGTSMLRHSDNNWMALQWTKGIAERLVVLGVGAAILCMQYMDRRTRASRILSGAGLGAVCVVAAFSPWRPAYAIQQLVNPVRIERSSLQAVFDSTRSVPLDAVSFVRNQREVSVVLPVRWQGLPEGAEVVPDRTEAIIRMPNGELLRPVARNTWNWSLYPVWNWANFALHEDLLQKVGAEPVDLDLKLFVTVYGRGRTYRMPIMSTGEQTVPEVGRCFTGHERYGFMLRCTAALKNTASIMTRVRDGLPVPELEWNRMSFDLSYTPLPTELWLGKPFRTAGRVLPGPAADAKAEVEFLVREPLGHFELPLAVKSVKLSEYVVRR
jgi:hypothetical protein